MQDKYQQLVQSMTLFEKASLCSGLDFWLSKPINRLNIPSIVMSDGPHGLRKENNEDTDNVALKCSYPATAFPPAVNMASTWNVDLIKKVGVALGEQCLNQNVDVILGPGTNIKRSPLCGRNFEYFSEDPYLSGKLCIAYIDGVQSTGVSTSLKHFAANSQEYLRMTINSIIDDRAMREMYLTAFEMAVKEAHPGTVMCSYNRINGVYSSDNKWLLTDVLRKEWGFDGIVVSDWNAVNNRVEGIRAGMDLEMPSSGGRTDKDIVKAVVSGDLLESDLDRVVYNLVKFIDSAVKKRDEGYFYNYREGHKLARKVAGESMVLLKNDTNLLPIDHSQEITILGALAKHTRYQGSGSSRINPYKLVNFMDYLDSHNLKYRYADGYTLTNDGFDEKLINEAVEIAKRGEKVVIFAGLTEQYESEGYDRQHMNMPESHNLLIQRVSEVNDNVIVVLLGGSPVEMPWIDKVHSVLNAYLPGEAAGESLADILYGIVNPSGKLAETYPIKLDDYIGSPYYKGGPKNVEHRESVYIGYRYYDSANKDVLFPFGYGLSYTTFAYSDLKIDKASMKDDETLKLSFKVKNTGTVDGAEIAQVYVRDTLSTIFRPDKELKGFKKVFLKAGEETEIEIELNKRSFAYYNTYIHDWHVESGSFEILVGASSRDIKLKETVEVISTAPDVEIPDLRNELPTYYNIAEATQIPDDEFYTLYEKPVPPNKQSVRGAFDMNTTIGELKCCFVGKVFVKVAPGIIKGQVPDADMTTMLMLQQGMEEMPLRGLSGVTSGLLDQCVLEGILLWGNKHRLRGLIRMLKGGIKSLKNIKNLKNDSRVKLEQKRLKEEKLRLQEENKQALSVQKASLNSLKKDLDELKKLRKDIESDEELMKYINSHEQHIELIKNNIEKMKVDGKESVEQFKQQSKGDLKAIKEEEKVLKHALKEYMNTADKQTDEENLSEENTNKIKDIILKLRSHADEEDK